MIYFKKATFIKSVVNNEETPTRLNEVVFIGRSNVGKSSLINALTNNSKLAYTSKNPGHTRLLNYYLIDDKFYFVDAPGYGFSQKKGSDYTFYGDMVENYFKENDYLKLVVFLLDSRRTLNEEDKNIFKFLKDSGYKFIIVMTKFDKLNMSEKSKLDKLIKTELSLEINTNLIYKASINNEKLLLEISNKIKECVGY